ncbi:Tetratricopeptide repeat protein 14 [Auxenochlorella protothecoides]|uniref:Tetratricopeptide repeat protein 14 n=1 Tax=Auxenochlorella protothecoides TaxID=3075 RepID=A0A087SMU0_AUXPR|nr:Tetratricopeptide repeat protein 14 [Auxenochlorella protothecoides]KFM27044.1 Tetratricopeptide repeat protein 14 [Auxenochlorella protothecoides]
MKARVARGWSMEALGRGVKLAREGRAPEAIPHYLKALELDPTNPDAHVALGAAHANAGSWQEAADAMAAALALDPDHANALAYERRIAQRAKEEGDDDAVDWPRSPSPERGEGLDLRRALRIVKKHRRQKGGAQQGHKTKHKRRHSKSRKHKHRSGD